MARALARGWAEPILCSDGGSGRAAALVAEVGGEALDSNAELAERAEMVFLCHKPAQLESVAEEIAGSAGVVVSVLGATPLDALRAAYLGAAIVRTMPNTPVEVRRGVVCMASEPGSDRAILALVRQRLEQVATVVEIDDAAMNVATAVMGVAPAYVSLVAEAQVDAAVKHGMPAPRAAQLFIETLAGTAELLAARGYDTLAVRREVTSPGGSTARGLAVLEAAGLRAAFASALGAVVGDRAR
jgi:pyrroline-5-carboxylate reductase